MVSYGNKYPLHNARPHVVEQSGQCARALREVAVPSERLVYLRQQMIVICGSVWTKCVCPQEVQLYQGP